MRFLILALLTSSASVWAQQADHAVTNSVANYKAYQYSGGWQEHTWQQGLQYFRLGAADSAWSQMKNNPYGDIDPYVSSMCGSGQIKFIQIGIDFVMSYQTPDNATIPNGNERQHVILGYSCNGNYPTLTEDNEGTIYFSSN